MKKTSDIIWQDIQHQRLFETIDLIQSGAPGPLILHQLNHYMENHFATEEAYMQQLNYPNTESHIRAHDKFRQELNNLLSNGFPEDPQHLKMLSTYLYEWLALHVMNIDKELEEFILQADRK